MGDKPSPSTWRILQGESLPNVGEARSPLGMGAIPCAQNAHRQGTASSPQGRASSPPGMVSFPKGDGLVAAGDGLVPDGEGTVPAGDDPLPRRGWSREQAIEYTLSKQSNMTPEAASHYVDRIAVLPGQMTTYGVGEREILALRERARQALGERFDVKEFHDRVLENGSITLGMLEEVVER